MSLQPLIFTIFGGTGNLAYNKLFPAFYQLFHEEKIDNKIIFIAIGRREKTSEQYRNELQEIISQKIKGYSKTNFENFKHNVFYYKMDFTKEQDYKGLEEYFKDLNVDLKTRENRIFYLATAPTDFPDICESLSKYRLLDTNGFKRAVFEKPFGYDLDSAIEINKRISAVFGEEHIYRIDHYLGKEMIQNILTIRFTNQIFKSVWNKDSIDNVQITVKESVGVEDRGGYYDKSGALRDMIQNHLLQILALIAMDPPASLDTDSIRDEKVKILRSIKVNSEMKSPDDVVFGQYEGYRHEEKVDSFSTTETYVAIKCEVDSNRWKGVPFFLRTGKYLNSREAQIIIEFKTKDIYSEHKNSVEPNLLIIKIQPEEGIYFRINTKKPRSGNNLMPVSMDYCQSCNFTYRSPEAYERLLYDIIQGDSTLFTRWDEVKYAWIFIKNLIDCCQGKDESIVNYARGSQGPDEADRLIGKTERKWWKLEDLEKAQF